MPPTLKQFTSWTVSTDACIGLLIHHKQNFGGGLLSRQSQAMFYKPPPEGLEEPEVCNADLREARNTLTELTEVVHMILFFIMTMFLVEIGAIYKLASTMVRRWHR